ncbi:AraC family transcriptional regulator [Undibacterium sp. Jales W-56]|uniref:helix-turn-helix transcriptional regulator n=1 Tax=Undibacterium sp. Jales W-56 TaxID=2897325 RepID=UPI0021D22ED7|nr:AraC family transcriptional regulator [Undibacterium sp. Jales W-56]MCU6434397.1 AraC family transcriptional regulator [Undibacterium sp. Jales W-56]
MSLLTASPLLSVQDAIFPAHPFAGLFAIGREQQWRLHDMFPAFFADGDGPLQAAARISYVQARAGLLQARQRGGADVALLSGSRKSLADLGGMSAGMLAQPTLGRALAFGLEYQLIAGSMLQLSLETDSQQAALVSHALFEDQELQDFLDVDHLATALNAARQLPCNELPIARIELRGNLQASRSMLEDFFACPVILGADASRMLFAHSLLEMPLSGTGASAQTARAACDTELAAIGVLGKQSLVRKLVAMQCEFFNVQDMAAALELSPRSLHRLLAREGTSYQHITESVRIERAKRLLSTALSVEDIAEELGYSDARSFRRAFKRWTTLTPSEFRFSR